MSPEELIEESIRCYPLIFRNRSQVLDHLFFVIGNGFEWIDGELVKIGRERESYNPHHWTRDYLNRFAVDIKMGLPADAAHLARTLLWNMENDFEDRCISEEAAERAKRYGVYSPYPESSYSKINNIPSNVKIEWVVLAAEARRVRNEFIATCPFPVAEDGSIPFSWGHGEHARAFREWYKKENT